MIGSIEIQTNKVSIEAIAGSERPFFFRSPDPERALTLKAEIAMLGLIYPITVELLSSGQYVILDGYRRFDAIQSLRQEAGGWDEIPAVIIPQGQLLTHEKLILLREKNVGGENAYKAFEKARLFDDFLKRGLSLEEMSAHAQTPADDIQAYLYLMGASPTLQNIVIESGMPDAYALALIRRFQHWLLTPYKDQAEAVARKIADHLKNEPVSLLGWKFLLDFYWGARPFMFPRVLIPDR